MLSKLKGGNEAYQICGDIQLNGTPNLTLFKKAFEKITTNNEMLRCSYQIKDGELVRSIANEIEIEVIQGNLKEESREEFEKRWRKPFDLAKAPLWRLGTLIDENGENHFLFNFHHIISDGTSIDIIMSEFVESINGRELTSDKRSYCDFVYEESANLKSNESKAKKEWWSSVLTPLPNPLNLPYKGVRPEVNDFKGDTVHFTIESDTLEKLKIKAREQRTTTFIYFLSTWTTFLGCLAGQEDFCIGTPWDRRNDGEYDQTVGMFAQSLALRVQPKQTQSFKSYLKDVREMCTKLYEHADYPMEELLDELKVPRNINRNPLFDTMFIYENGHMQGVELGEVKGIVREEKGTYTTFDVSLEMSEELGKVYCTINYSTHLFNKEQIEEWIVWYKT
ncbi:condensation domain-containing protein [Cellulosilyticum ruminicola]|uniref:condensation domain-containing protein n=1 Tax=Cellulosilyticum ruminicola TaxID=425254 RepID=UPI0006CF7036|nr:condensation domain-containing protein [Cellulosilyticum ruminicola]